MSSTSERSAAMKEQDARKRILELQATIAEADEKYYRVGHSPMTDEAYDKLARELADLENKFPQLQAETSPSLQVGSDLTPGFRKVAHKYPMLSIQNTYSEEEMLDWNRQV